MTAGQATDTAATLSHNNSGAVIVTKKHPILCVCVRRIMTAGQATDTAATLSHNNSGAVIVTKKHHILCVCVCAAHHDCRPGH